MKPRHTLSMIVLALLLIGCSTSIAKEKVLPTATPLLEQAVADPTVGPSPAGEQEVVAGAVADLQTRLPSDVSIAVQEVVPTDFSDTSLGVPQPGQAYAQVLTPGYVIRLAAGNQVYVYHGSGERVVLVAQEAGEVSPPPGDQPAPPGSGEGEYSRVAIADTGLSIDVPAGWLRLEPDWLWTPAEGSELYLGIQWVDLQPPQEAEPALLPAPSQTLYSEEAMLDWGSGRRFLLEVYGSTTQGQGKAPVESVELHVLITVNQEDRRRAFDLYVKGHSMDDMGSLEPLLQRVVDTSTMAGVISPVPSAGGLTMGAPDPATGWPVLLDEVYGYQIALPADWTWKELPVQVPGMPDDWPVTRIALLYPQAWDAQINRSGPPDPTAKSVVAPLQVEVLVGPPEQFRRVYPEPTQTETGEINGLPVTVEKDVYEAMTLTRYVVVSPADPEVHVVISDQMTGFPDRVAGSEAVSELVPEIVTTLRFPR